MSEQKIEENNNTTLYKIKKNISGSTKRVPPLLFPHM